MKNYIYTNKKLLLFLTGLLIFTGLNIFSAFSMGVHYDEAYYWLYSKHLSLGYFDHPPMVAWLIFMGTQLFEGSFGLRFFTIVLSTLSMVLLWRLSPQIQYKPILFWSIVYSLILIHPYSFIATPDAPLFFFTALFFYVLKRYLLGASYLNVILLALITAAMFYSKYHAVLIVSTTFLLNYHLLKTKLFWVYFAFVSFFMLPHLFWQFDHQFASFRYHLIDSHQTTYNPLLTLEYIVTQFMVLGPIAGWLFLWFLFKYKGLSTFEKTLKWNAVTVVLFFGAGTLSGDFEAHWTLVATIPLLLFALKSISISIQWQKLFYIAGAVNFTALLIIRIVLATPLAGEIKALGYFHGWDINSRQLIDVAHNRPVVFQDCWNKAARFGWYTNNSDVVALNSGLHRRNQFDIWDNDEMLTGQNVVIATTDSAQFTNAIIIKTPKGNWYLKNIENFRSYYNLGFGLNNSELRGNVLWISVNITNTYNYPIEINNEEARLQLYERQHKWQIMTETTIEQFSLQPGETKTVEAELALTSPLNNNAYLFLKIGQLNPIPQKLKIEP
jgi:hypothetical protein